MGRITKLWKKENKEDKDPRREESRVPRADIEEQSVVQGVLPDLRRKSANTEL